ncbi:MAG: sodium:solute symporter family protein [Cyclobacteriaceae bacterium]
MVYLIIILYIAFTFFGSLVGRKKTDTPEGYFLANRNLKTLSLFFTILATNFSAFYFLGFAGEAYRIGYAYYTIMALGTSLACLSFFVIGSKVWKLGKEGGHITPSELIYSKTGSKPLSIVYATVMVVFTFPYLALQIVGAGYIMESITGGEVPYFLGATILTAITIIYVFLGGMHSVAKTDLKQGVIMAVLMLAAVYVISDQLGGFELANLKVAELKPELFDREGADSFYTPQKWFSFLIFWFFCIPMFPQLFMRFYVAKKLDHLKKAALLYATVPLFISILPVIIGVFGHLTFPGLEGKDADQILPQMLIAHSSPWFAALVMTGALAAFMSTLDSQLLALGTIVSRDFGFQARSTDLKAQVKFGRIAILIIAVIGLAIAYQPPATIFDMGKLAFAGLSVLFPVTFFILRMGGVPAAWGLISIAVGEFLLVGFYYGLVPIEWAFGFEVFIPVITLSFLICAIGKISRKAATS